MKRKTTILLSSILAGSLLVGGAFAAYAVTDNANAIKVQVTPGAPVVPDTQVELTWGEKVHANISGLERNKLTRLAYVTVVSDVDYTGLLQLAMEDVTEGKAPEAKAMFDYLEVYTYEGKVDLDEEGNLPEGATEIEELRILPATALDDDGNKSYKLEVDSDSEGVKFSMFVKLVCEEEYLGQMTDDVVEFTIDWNMNDDGESYPATPSDVPATAPGYYLVGSFSGWTPYESKQFTQTAQVGELRLDNITFGETDEFKAYQIVSQGEPAWIPGGEAANVTVPAGTYDILFAPTYRADWETGSGNEGQFGRVGYFWFMPKSVTPDPEPGTSEIPTSETPTSDIPEPTLTDYVIWGSEDGTTWGALAPLVENTGSENEEYMALNVSLSQGTEFVMHLVGDTWVKNLKTGQGSADANFTTNDSGNLVCSVAGSYDFYVAAEGIWVQTH